MQILSQADVQSRLKISRSTLWRWCHDASLAFPSPVRLGPRRVGFVEAEILAWVNANRVTTQAADFSAPAGARAEEAEKSGGLLGKSIPNLPPLSQILKNGGGDA